MHRRRFLAAILATSASITVQPALACDMEVVSATPDSVGPVDAAARSFIWPGEDGPRSLTMRVSVWALSDAATAQQDAIMAVAIPEPLPRGEFYGGSLQIVAVAEVAEGIDLRAHAWHTIVGVAAFTTAYVVFTLRNDNLLWHGIVVASRPETASDMAVQMVRYTENLVPVCATVDMLLPTLDDVPAGADVEDVPYDGGPVSG